MPLLGSRARADVRLVIKLRRRLSLGVPGALKAELN